MLPHTARFCAFNVFRKQKFCQFKKISQKIFRPIRNVIRTIIEEIRYILLIGKFQFCRKFTLQAKNQFDFTKLSPNYFLKYFYRDKLAPVKLNRYKDDVLFYMFYTNVGDVLQLAAAAEL